MPVGKGNSAKFARGGSTKRSNQQTLFNAILTEKAHRLYTFYQKTFPLSRTYLEYCITKEDSHLIIFKQCLVSNKLNDIAITCAGSEYFI